MTPLDTFSERLRHVADIKKKVQADLSKDLGKDRAAVTRWWNGGVAPGQRNMRMIADYFGCDLEWLSTGEGEPFPTKEIETPPKTVRARAIVEHPYGHTATEENLVDKDNERESPIPEMMYMTGVVLGSNTVYRSALASNIRAFYQAVIGEEQMEDMSKKMEMMRKDMEEMKEMMRGLAAPPTEKKRAGNDN